MLPPFIILCPSSRPSLSSHQCKWSGTRPCPCYLLHKISAVLESLDAATPQESNSSPTLEDFTHFFFSWSSFFSQALWLFSPYEWPPFRWKTHPWQNRSSTRKIGILNSPTSSAIYGTNSNITKKLFINHHFLLSDPFFVYSLQSILPVAPIHQIKHKTQFKVVYCTIVFVLHGIKEENINNLLEPSSQVFNSLVHFYLGSWTDAHCILSIPYLFGARLELR